MTGFPYSGDRPDDDQPFAELPAGEPPLGEPLAIDSSEEVGFLPRLRWSPASASFGVNPGYAKPGTSGGRRFAPTDHLAFEAVAAFADGELSASARDRAAEHLALCPQCRRDVEEQRDARLALRHFDDVDLPHGLLGSLSQIPTREIDVRDAPNASDASERRAPRRFGFPVHRGPRHGH